jgi:hypothetical protein
MWAKSDTEPITYVAGKHVQMNMKYFLPRRFAVREEKIHSFAPDLALIQCRGKALRYAEHMRAFFFFQICKASGVSVGNYKRVSGIDGLNVKKGRAAIILVNHADFQFARKYLAKYAVIRLAHNYCCFSSAEITTPQRRVGQTGSLPGFPERPHRRSQGKLPVCPTLEPRFSFFTIYAHASNWLRGNFTFKLSCKT